MASLILSAKTISNIHTYAFDLGTLGGVTFRKKKVHGKSSRNTVLAQSTPLKITHNIDESHDGLIALANQLIYQQDENEDKYDQDHHESAKHEEDKHFDEINKG